MRIGIDWGGSKLEVIALNDAGTLMLQHRIPTPKDYQSCIKAVVQLVDLAKASSEQSGTVGIGIPGSLSPKTGLVRNGNTTWLNGKPLGEDLQMALGQEVRIQNDANCFAVSEAVDGAGQGARVVAGVILGTGCGCGLAINGKAHKGRSAIAGEFGHIALTPMNENEYPGPPCWCGRSGCLETYVSGPAFIRDFEQRTGEASNLDVAQIIALESLESKTCYKRYVDRLARGLSMLINMIDPDVIVLGGGMSNIRTLYDDMPKACQKYVFTDEFDTPILQAKHGDSSGARGAAWLW